MVQPDHAPELTQNPGLMQAMRRQDAFWGRLASHCPRIVPMIYGFDPSQEESVDYVAELLATGHYGGVGEIEFRHVRMAIAHAPDSPALQAIYSMLAERGLTFHFQAELRHDQALGERVRAVVAGHPELRFVWLGCSPEMLEWNLDNLWCGGFLHPQLPRPGSRMVRRTLFGSDTGPAGFPAASAPALPYQDLEVALDRAREVLGGLPPSDAAAAAHGNFEAALPARR